LKNTDYEPGAGPLPASPEFSPSALVRVLTDQLHLAPATRLILAYSGGLDSHILLHALCQSRRAWRWQMEAVHVDHGLQPASREWAAHCQRTCAALDVPCHVERVAVSQVRALGPEAAARAARYAALATHIKAGDVLLTAHQQNDQAETVLLQLLRGAGVPGLAAMPDIIPFALGRHARPLLAFSRPALHAYARHEKLIWIEDTSNADEHLARNFLRRCVLPRLETRWPQAARSLTRSARHAAQAANLLDELAQADLAACRAEPAGALRVSALLGLSPARQSNLLRFWIGQHSLPLPSEHQLDTLRHQLQHLPRSRHACVRWPGAEVRRYRDVLTAVPATTILPSWPDREWDMAVPLDHPGGWRLCAIPAVGRGLARVRLQGRRVHVQARRGGETCQLPGRGHHHKLKKLLQEAGVPPWDRARLPLVYVDDELAAVGDLWTCEPFAAHRGEEALRLVVEPVPPRPGDSTPA
jgi:tRNA(Ile)-lysidine synthase